MTLVDQLSFHTKVSFLPGDPGGSVGCDRWHDGTLHWLLHPQWHRDSLLCCKVLSQENLKEELRIARAHQGKLTFSRIIPAVK